MTVTRRRVPRLFLERALGGDSVELDEREAHYLGHVLRLKRGDELVTFNGRGEERHASVATLKRGGAELALGASVRALPEPRLEITLLQALPKSDAMDLIVQKATELGVRRVLPVYSEHSVVKLEGARAERRLDHWRKIAQSACEQSGRHVAPDVAAAAPLEQRLRELPADALGLALDLDAPRALAALAAEPARLVLAIGPEGGFAAADLARLDTHGFERVTLGPRVLRAETAAIAATAVAQARWGDF